MSLAKKIGIFFAGVFVFIAAIGGLVLYATSGIVDTSDEFFAAAKANDYEAAYKLTTQQLQAETTPEGLGAFLEANGLHKVAETSWSSRSTESNKGELEGSVTTADGATIPLTLGLIYENDAWKISAIEVEAPSLSGAPVPAAASVSEAPDQEDSPAGDPELFDKARRTISFHNFALSDALLTRDFGMFAFRWGKGTSAAELEKGLGRGPMTDEDLVALEDADVILDSAAYNEDGNIEAQGRSILVTGKLRMRYVFRPRPNDPDTWDIEKLDLAFAAN